MNSTAFEKTNECRSIDRMPLDLGFHMGTPLT